jgi:hypothetical protein
LGPELLLVASDVDVAVGEGRVVADEHEPLGVTGVDRVRDGVDLRPGLGHHADLVAAVAGEPHGGDGVEDLGECGAFARHAPARQGDERAHGEEDVGRGPAPAASGEPRGGRHGVGRAGFARVQGADDAVDSAGGP